MCSANAAQSANHALPKPADESAGGACLMEIAVLRILNQQEDNRNRNQPPVRARRAITNVSRHQDYRATSLIRASKFASESRKKVIHKSWVGIFATTCGSSTKCTPFSFSLPCAD